MAECRKGIPSKYSRVTRSLFLNEGRGLSGVYFVISDDHCGITKAVDKHFQGATWQRCQVHLMRNLLGHSPTRLRGEVAAAAKRVFQAADMTEARRRLTEFVEQFDKSAPKVVACMEAGFEDAMAIMALPESTAKNCAPPTCRSA